MIEPAWMPGAVVGLLGLLLIGVSVQLILKRVGMNPFYWVRIPEACKSEAHWYAINAYGGRVLAVAGVAMLLVGGITFLWPPASEAGRMLVALAPAPILLVTLVPILRYASRL